MTGKKKSPYKRLPSRKSRKSKLKLNPKLLLPSKSKSRSNLMMVMEISSLSLPETRTEREVVVEAEVLPEEVAVAKRAAEVVVEKDNPELKVKKEPEVAEVKEDQESKVKKVPEVEEVREDPESRAKKVPKVATEVEAAEVAEVLPELKVRKTLKVATEVEVAVEKEDPESRARKALKVATEAEVAEVNSDPELRVEKEPKVALEAEAAEVAVVKEDPEMKVKTPKVVMKVLSSLREEKKLITRVRMSTLPANKEKNGTHMIERMALVEVEVSPRMATARATGVTTLTRSSKLRLSMVNHPRSSRKVRLLWILTKTISSKMPLRLKLQLKLRLRRKRKPNNRLTKNTWPARRCLPSRRKLER